MKHMMMIETKQKRIETYNNDRNLTAEDDEGSPDKMQNDDDRN